MESFHFLFCELEDPLIVASRSETLGSFDRSLPQMADEGEGPDT